MKLTRPLVLTCLLAACAGNGMNASVPSVTRGKSTIADVEAAMGQPDARHANPAGTETLVYNRDGHPVSYYFGADGILRNSSDTGLGAP